VCRSLPLLFCSRQVVGADSKQFDSYLENTATTGRPLLVTDVEEPLDRTVSRLVGQLSLNEGEWRARVGDNEVRVADGFRLYMTTKLARPVLSHETPAHVVVVDFTLTDDAVTDQLLSYVFQLEKPVSRPHCSAEYRTRHLRLRPF